MNNDVVYILKNGSTNNNFELRYSLRSIENHLKNFGKVYIIGTKPAFLNDKVIGIEHADIYTNKARNIMAKILRACNEKHISPNFMFFNDDYFLLRPMDANVYPNYYKGDLEYTVKVNIGEYAKHAKATLDALIQRESTIYNYDTHYPIIFNKFLYRATVEKLDWEIPFGYISKSIYGNLNNLPGEFKTDCKISHAYTLPRILQLNENREMFSTSEAAMCMAMKKYIHSLYPEKSQFEI